MTTTTNRYSDDDRYDLSITYDPNKSSDSEYPYDGYESEESTSKLLQLYQEMLENPIIDEPLRELMEMRVDELLEEEG